MVLKTAFRWTLKQQVFYRFTVWSKKSRRTTKKENFSIRAHAQRITIILLHTCKCFETGLQRRNLKGQSKKNPKTEK